MIALAGLVRKGFVQGDLTSVLSPRTIINWADNYKIFEDFKKFVEKYKKKLHLTKAVLFKDWNGQSNFLVDLFE